MAEGVNEQPSLRTIVALIVLSLLPYWLLPISHCLSNRETATGFYNYELPYYMANGRAAFERGNGILYPNPYDPDPAAPSIYAHWLLWALGAITLASGADPGHVLLAVTFVSTLAFGATTWKLVKACLPAGGSIRLTFLLAMWGGGLLVPGGCIAALLGVQARLPWALQFDPFDGMYFLNWGRNAIFATEAVYHCLAAACWISEIRGRRFSGTLWCAALATTHPWSGLQLLLILNFWRLVQLIQQRDRTSATYLLVSASMLMMFLGYYKLWLPGFEHHRQLEEVWTLDWSLTTRSAILAYFPVGLLVWLRYRKKPAHSRDQMEASRSSSDVTTHQKSALEVPGESSEAYAPGATRFSQSEQFLFCALVVSLGLVFHDRFVRPVQPLHFTRGYIWMPLFLLGLPVLQSGLRRLCQERRFSVKAAGIVVLLIMLADNLTFSLIYAQKMSRQDEGYHLTADDRALFQEIHRHYTGSVVLTESTVLNYLLPTYANARPWIGHLYNTPNQPDRERQMEEIFADGDVSADRIPAEIDLLLIKKRRNDTSLTRSPDWVQQDSTNSEWTFWTRKHLQRRSSSAVILQ
jgi:hypothetical protein